MSTELKKEGSIWPLEALVPAQPSRGVQNNPKPKIRTENLVPEPKYLIFSVRVAEPIFFSGYRFGYGLDSLTKRYPKTRIFLFFIFKINRLIFILQIGNKNVMLCGMMYIGILFYGLKYK